MLASEIACALLRPEESIRPGHYKFVNCVIVGNLNLEGASIPAWLEFDRCTFHGGVNVKHAKLHALYFRQCDFRTLSCKALTILMRKIASEPQRVRPLDSRRKKIATLYVQTLFGNRDHKKKLSRRHKRPTGICATGLRLRAGFRFGRRSSCAYIDLRAAKIAGTIMFQDSEINPEGLLPEKLRRASFDAETGRYWARNGCAVFARGVVFSSNVTIDGCNIFGEVSLSDARIEESLFISRSLIIQPWDICDPVDPDPPLFEVSHGPDQLEESRHYAIRADRLKIRGRFSISAPQKLEKPRRKEVRPVNFRSQIPASMIFGKIRLIGIDVGGALVVSHAVVHSIKKSAIAFTGANIRGLVSFANSRISCAIDRPAIEAVRTIVEGDFILHRPLAGEKIDPADICVKMRKRTADGDGECDDEAIDRDDVENRHWKNHRLNSDTAFLDPERRGANNFLAAGGNKGNQHKALEKRLYYYVPAIFRNFLLETVFPSGKTAAKFASFADLFEMNAASNEKNAYIQAAFQKLAEHIDVKLGFFDKENSGKAPASHSQNSLAWNRKRTGRRDFFWCPNGMTLEGTTIKGAFDGGGALLGHQTLVHTNHPALNAERVTIQKGVFLGGDFLSVGAVRFRRALIGADFNCVGAIMIPGALDPGLELDINGEDGDDDISHCLDNPTIPPNPVYTLNLSGAIIRGNLDLRAFRVVEPVLKPSPPDNSDSGDAKAAIEAQSTPQSVSSGADDQSFNPKKHAFAIYADRAVIEGAAFLRNGFSATGRISFESAAISRSFYFEPVMTSDRFIGELDIKKKLDFDRPVGHSWYLDLSAATIGNTLSVRCIFAGSVFIANDLSEKGYNEFTLQALEDKVDFWARNEENRSRYLPFGYKIKRARGFFPYGSELAASEYTGELAPLWTRILGSIPLFPFNRSVIVHNRIYRITADGECFRQKLQHKKIKPEIIRDKPVYRFNAAAKAIDDAQEAKEIEPLPDREGLRERPKLSIEARTANTYRKIRVTATANHNFWDNLWLRDSRKRRLFDQFRKVRWESAPLEGNDRKNVLRPLNWYTRIPYIVLLAACLFGSYHYARSLFVTDCQCVMPALSELRFNTELPLMAAGGNFVGALFFATLALLAILAMAARNDTKTKYLKTGVKGVIDVVNTKADSYTDDHDYIGKPWMRPFGLYGHGVPSWPVGITTRLEGFKYNRFGTRSIDSTRAIARVAWLKTQYVRTDGLRISALILSVAAIAGLTYYLVIANLGLSEDDANSYVHKILFWNIPFRIPFLEITLSRGELMTFFQWFAIALAPVWMAGFYLVLNRDWYSRGSAFIRRLLDNRIINNSGSAALVKAINGFFYRGREYVSDRAKGTAEIKEHRLAWHSYRSQPWLQCAKALRDAGLEQHARRVLLSRERLNSKTDRFPFLEKMLRLALLITFGRGLVRIYPIFWFMSVLFAAIVLFHIAFELNMMRPADAIILTHLESSKESPPPDNQPGMVLKTLPNGYSTSRALIYAFEVMTPGLPMRQENRWAPCPQEYIVRDNMTFEPPEEVLSRICRPLQPDSNRDALPYGAIPFTDKMTLANSALGNSDGHSKPCAPLHHEAEKVLAANRAMNYADMRQKVLAASRTMTYVDVRQKVQRYYSGITVRACFLGVSLKNGELKGESFLNNFFERDMLRQFTWVFVAYGWVLVGGLAISLSQLLLRDV